jgi:hypothetical protein
VNRSDSFILDSPTQGNPKPTLNPRFVTFEASFQEALQAGIHVSDGSIYVPEPAIDLIEEVTARELPFPAPDATTHVRVTYSGGPDRFVSFSPRTFTEQDDYRQYLVAELGRVYRDGVEVPVWQDDEPLAEALEEWTLGRRVA